MSGLPGALARALDGVAVVDLTRYLPGPYCTRLLADMGAAVVKVEGPGGDPMRHVAWYDLLNRGKRVIALDLQSAGGRAGLEAQLAAADVCVEGFRPSTARAIGVDGATLAARHPRLVHCSIGGYRASGPDAERSGHDLNYQADAGLLAADPRVPGLLLADVTGGLRAAIAIVGALFHRGRTGRGAALALSLYDAAASWVPFAPPSMLRGDYACYNVYATADGGHVALGALEPKFWERFCRRVRREDWIGAQFAADPDRTRLRREVAALLRSRSAAEWEADLRSADCCFSVVRLPAAGPD